MKLREYRPHLVRVEMASGRNTASFAVGRDGCVAIDCVAEGVLVRIDKAGEVETYLIRDNGYGVPDEKPAVKADERPAPKPERPRTVSLP